MDHKIETEAPVVTETRAQGALDAVAIRDLVLLVLALKALLLCLGVIAAEVRLNRSFRAPTEILGLWLQWDTRHYLEIAEKGYAPPPESVTLVFPPLFPLLIRATSLYTGSVESAAVVLSSLLSLLPGIYLYRLARLDLDEETSFRAVTLFFVFPTAFFLHLAYTESLFLTTALGAFLAAREGRWRHVAIWGLLAGLTRINAFVLAPALLFEAWGNSSRGRLPRLFAAVSVSLGVVAYLALNAWVAGDAFEFVTIQRDSFYRSFAPPWDGVIAVMFLAWEGGSDSMSNGVLQALCIPLMAVALFGALRQRRSYAVWVAGNAFLFTAQGFWISLPRLCLSLFPLFPWLALRLRGRVASAVWLAASLLLLSFFAGQFAQGWWVS